RTGEDVLSECEARGLACQASRASSVIKPDHLIHDHVPRVAFTIALIRMGGRRRSCDLRDRQIVTSPHHKSAGMERAIKPQSNFSRNITKAKSKLRCEHYRLSYRRIGKRFFSAPAHDWQFNAGQRLLAITNQSEEASDCGRFAGRQVGNLSTLICGVERNC